MTGGRTPHRFSGPLIEEDYIVLEPDGAIPPSDLMGTIHYRDGQFSLRDDIGSYDPRTGFDLSNLLLTKAGTLVYVQDGVLVTKA